MSNHTFNDTAMGCVGERDLENCVRGIFLDPGDELSFTGAPEVFPGGEAGGLPGEPPEGPPPLWPPPLPADGLIDARVFFILEMIINCGLINIISVLGAVGNSLSIFILHKHSLKSSSMNVVLASMALADLLILVTLPFRKISLFIGLYDKVLARTVESYVLAYGFLAFNRTWALISHSHVVIIAVERFLAVTFPFKIRIWVTPLKMALICGLTHVVWYVLLWPMHTTFDLQWVDIPASNRTVAIAWLSDFHLKHESAINFYTSFVINLINVSLQLITVLVCSVAVGVRIVSIGRKRKEITSGAVEMSMRDDGLKTSSMADTSSGTTVNSMASRTTGVESGISPSLVVREGLVTGQDEDERDNGTECQGKQNKQVLKEVHSEDITVTVTCSGGTNRFNRKNNLVETRRKASAAIDKTVVKMLLLVCVVYVILIIPTFLLFVFQHVFPQLKEPRWVRVNFLATSLSMLLLALNSSVNFIIYMYMSHRFRKTFHAICRCPCGK